jgi:hypothetical protein
MQKNCVQLIHKCRLIHKKANIPKWESRNTINYRIDLLLTHFISFHTRPDLETVKNNISFQLLTLEWNFLKSSGESEASSSRKFSGNLRWIV